MSLMRLRLQAPHLHESLSRICRLLSLFCCTFFILKRLPKLRTLQNLPCPAPPACRGPAPATCSKLPSLLVALALHRFRLPRQPPALTSAHSSCSTHLLVLAGSWGKRPQPECASVSRQGSGGVPSHSCPPARTVQFPTGRAPAACPTSCVLTGYPTPGAGDTGPGGDALSLP